MSVPEPEPEANKQVPTLVWAALGALLVAAFVAAALLMGRPSAGLPAAEPPANQADQAVVAAPEPKATKLD